MATAVRTARTAGCPPPAAWGQCVVSGPSVLARIDNDLMAASNLDAGYTSGVRLEAFSRSMAKSTSLDDWVTRFADVGLADPCRSEAGTQGAMRSWFVAQEIYTPRNIEAAEPQPNDRPWAGVLYAGRSWESVGFQDRTLRARRIELGVGVVGDASLARQSQERIHSITGSQSPQGWDNQLHNRIAFALRVLDRRRWAADHADLTVHYGGMLGTLQGHLHAGTTVRYGHIGCELASPGVVSHALRVTGDGLCVQDNSTRFYGFVGMDVKAVGWNALIDGQPRFGESHVDARHLVGEARAGVSLSTGRWTFTYLLAWRTSEFTLPGKSDLPSTNYAGITLSYN